jgi:hypothetical protein
MGLVKLYGPVIGRLTTVANSGQNLLKVGEECDIIDCNGGASMADEEHLKILKQAREGG